MRGVVVHLKKIIISTFKQRNVLLKINTVSVLLKCMKKKQQIRDVHGHWQLLYISACFSFVTFALLKVILFTFCIAIYF